MTESQKNILSSLGVNFEEVLERFVDNEELYLNCIIKFKGNDYFENFKNAFQAGNVTEAFEAIHALKGVVGNLGFKWLYEKSEEVTEILRAGSLDVSQELLFELQEEYDRVIENVNKL